MTDFDYKGQTGTPKLTHPIKVSWESPSNIAIVKYWGKTGMQLPVNPSVSMSLSEAKTSMSITAWPGIKQGGSSMEFWFEGKLNPAFAERIGKFLQAMAPMFPFLEELNLKLESSNSFPHSTGIASSASAFSSLALCLCSLEKEITGIQLSAYEFYRKASYVARLGSGSACRSLYPGFAIWGASELVDGSTNLAAVPVPGVHPAFEKLHDSIIIVDRKEKSVSSSEGHSRMNGHPFAQARIEQAQQNTSELLKALREGDRDAFIRITENEAFTLHALMMTSANGFMLMQPDTVKMISRIQEIRKSTGLKICFTLDAGPNIHLLYFDNEAEQVRQLIVEDLVKKIEQPRIIHDGYGNGPQWIA